MALVQGTANELQRVQRDLYLLAETARGHAAVASAIVNGADDALDRVREVEGGSVFAEALNAFLSQHGHLGHLYDDLALPSWQDDPSLVVAELRKRLLERQEDPEARRLRLAAKGAAMVQRVRERLFGRPEDLSRFEDALALARDVAPLTEDHNYWLDRMLHAHLRRFVLRVGERLRAVGVFADAANVFYLHTEEVRCALRSPEDMRAVVAERRVEYAQWSAVRPPKHLGKPSEPNQPSRFFAPLVPQEEGHRLRGIGACAGTARGPARIVLSADDFSRVRRGDILVCGSCNPSWVPLFGIIAGLVTDTGSVLSHAAVVAREFGVPAVVGTGEATRMLRDGQIVEIDGSAGEVRLL
jgi:pyruvate,water dikinase